MSKLKAPYILRDFRQGRYTPDVVSHFLSPENSVKNAVNVNFDTIVGSGTVRPGTTLLGATVASGKAPLGLSTFVGHAGSPNLLLSVFKGASNATLYYFDTAWHASDQTGLSNSKKHRFAVLGGRSFFTNTTDGMKSSADGATWTTADCIPSGLAKPSLIFRFGARLLATGDPTYPDRIWFSSIIDPTTTPFITWAMTVSRAYTNDPAPGTNVALNMSDTSGYVVGYPVTVSSTAGSEAATVVSITTNTSITVNSLALDHTTSSPLVSQSGDWIDINPDDGGNNVGFSSASTFVLVFKTTGMYRLDTIGKTADPENIFDVGAFSQECIVSCQGVTYYYSGIDIRRTNSAYPEEISRAGIQDILDAIPYSQKDSCAMGTDQHNVYFFCGGDVTVNTGKDNQQTIKNCVCKFSARDQTWSVHSYANNFQFASLFTDSTNGAKIRVADTAGNVQTLDLGTTDNTTAINFELETQDIEFGNRANIKQISDTVTVFTKNGIDSSFQCRINGTPKLKNLIASLFKRVNICEDVNLKANFFNFRWFGVSSGTAPIFEGFSLEDITDVGNVEE